MTKWLPPVLSPDAHRALRGWIAFAALHYLER